jgi:hypothetical protein
LEMRQKTMCVLSVGMQRAFLTLRLNEGQLQLLRIEMQDQLSEQFLCFGRIIKYSQETPRIVFVVLS